MSVPDQSTGIRKRMIIQKAMDELNERDRLLLVLFYYEGMSIEELAAVTGIRYANVKVSLSRARIRLRKELECYENELMSS
ncbi:hypothetical protein A2Y85_01905 [candidate division WOR-3 bacterium RBG_13_43_14]|uniref:RNA polymerase sigma factor 70 region 4 type 2 domain-containing protein n=1 Tax=candidate division WOR-3 bacterium RBG_13_43_14 TaxID=1802590 RepID=A0A1F4UF31_UNCW3|nr:MAG: hypothetical protein A2Y85_01905 [candidate division WOR-3 bacterium RBG_13_43_14]